MNKRPKTKSNQKINKSIKLNNLQKALIEGELSGDAGILDMQAIKYKARMQFNNSIFK